MKKYISPVILAMLVLSFTMAFRQPSATISELPTGAWEKRAGDAQEVLLFADGYFTHTAYDQTNRKFIRTRGGAVSAQGKGLSILIEFDTKEKEAVGQTIDFSANVSQNNLITDIGGTEERWTRLDAGNSGLAGLWQITARKQEGGLVPIHQTGTRKTVKILSGTRFQWAAIDPGTKQFMGTGGGRYTFQNGKYTEHIEFFSRDSSRVGSSLSFDGKLENGDWHHSGLSSRGEPIYEVWSRKKQQ
jgi:hypothetical protein